MSATVLAIGDSHCRFWGGLAPEILTYHVGPALAWSLASDESTTGARRRVLAALGILAPETWALLCFGEIDLRCHVLKHGGPVECALRYLDFVREAKRRHARIALWAPTATQPLGVPDDEAYPCVGTEAQRNAATQTFGECLRSTGLAHGVPVISILDLMLDRWNTKPETLSDGRHASLALRPAAMARLRLALSLEAHP